MLDCHQGKVILIILVAGFCRDGSNFSSVLWYTVEFLSMLTRNDIEEFCQEGFEVVISEN